jgi:hypothetical protein
VSVVAELWLQMGSMLWVVPVALGLVATGMAMDRADRSADGRAD